MLGFLGTVVGMIMAFFEISNVTGAVSPKLLASGIYTAMATTAVGFSWEFRPIFSIIFW
jgi:biopolymer transport protein ExbB